MYLCLNLIKSSFYTHARARNLCKYKKIVIMSSGTMLSCDYRLNRGSQFLSCATILRVKGLHLAKNYARYSPQINNHINKKALKRSHIFHHICISGK